jgi:Peptidase M76 family
MKTSRMRRATAASFALIAWLLLPKTGNCFYNPSTGRWLNRDPVGEKAGHNLYTFLRNKPASSVDLLGLMEVNECRRIRSKALQDDLTIHIILVEMVVLKCKLPNPGCACTCPGKTGAGYTDLPTGQVTLCTDQIDNERELIEVLRHEYIHSLDSCRKKYRPQTGKEAACSEIRAAVLSGECNKGGGQRGGDETFAQCVRDVALRALKQGLWLPAETYLDQAWPECFLSRL